MGYTMAEVYIAHISEDGRNSQLLEDHLLNVAQLAKEFGASIGVPDMAYGCGLAHDFGKYSDKFQKYIRGEFQGKVDHSTAGAQFLWKRQQEYNIFSLLGSFCIAGHHAGLPDYGGRGDDDSTGTLLGRMKKRVLPYEHGLERISYPNKIDSEVFLKFKNDPIAGALFIRMLFSCLVDADFLDTERYMLTECVQRGNFSTIKELEGLFFQVLTKKGYFTPKSDINRKRTKILKKCMNMGMGKPGLYTLTVPTGGGKTISSLAFAMKQAITQKKERIIYAIPYTSIIEQTAEVFEGFLGEDNIIEAHSQIEYDDSNESMEKKRLATENWDAPLIITTNVQFFESLFANRTSRCRKLHNIANSVIILDEAQMLPVDFLKPVLNTIEALVKYFNCTVILCSATQPHLERNGLLSMRPKEIMEDIPELYGFFKRVQFCDEGQLTYQAIGERLRRQNQILCIAGTKAEAGEIYEEIKDEDSFYLSTNLFPAHRQRVIREIKKRLKTGITCRVVSTSIISVGVDMDFPEVYLELSGLDSLIQGAGRCNREGKRPLKESTAHVFSTEKIMGSRFMKQERQIMAIVQQQFKDISEPEAIKKYFDELYKVKDPILDEKKIKELSSEMAFAEIGRSVKLIEDDTKSVFIPYDEEAQIIAEQLRCGVYTRELMRRAGRYIVNVRSSCAKNSLGMFEKLCTDGYATQLGEDLAILTNMEVYDEKMGFIYKHEEGMADFI